MRAAMRRWGAVLALLTGLGGCLAPGPGGSDGGPAVTAPAGAVTGAPIKVTPVPAPAKASAAPAAPAPKPAPDPAPAPLITKTPAQIACEDDGGRWQRAGGSVMQTCVHTTRDGGKSCRRQSDCEGLCLARSRSCAPLRPLFGCHDILQNDGRRVTLCID